MTVSCSRSSSEKIIALAGNPNVGKSTVFNLLTGLHQHTGNWPGKTVENAWGHSRYAGYPYRFVDLPGAYSLTSQSGEEKMARDFLLSGQADAVLIVCDACCLEKNLLLALQIINLKKEAVLLLNMANEAEKKEIYIDAPRLSRILGIPVLKLDARKKQNAVILLEQFRLIFDHTLPICSDSASDSLFFDSGSAPKMECPVAFAEMLCQECISYGPAFARKSGSVVRADRILTGRWTAFPILFFFLLALFWLTIVGANYPSALLSRFFSGLEQKLFYLADICHMPDILSDMLFSGIFRVVSWVVSVMLPPMAIFFPLFTLLEDSGILPRIAYDLDCPFQKCHACGKQALTMCMGFGCNAVGVTGCRIIDSPRERLLAILTNSFIPCNGRFPALIAVLTMFFVTADKTLSGSLYRSLLLTILILCSIGMTFFVSALLSHTVLKGMSSAFLLELPPYRRPQFGKVLVRSVLDRTLFVLRRAVLAAAPAGLVLWFFANFQIHSVSLLTWLTRFLSVPGRLLGLDGTILSAFLLGLPANEIVLPICGMSYLCQTDLTEMTDVQNLHMLLVTNGWTEKTALCFLLFSLFHWPCSTTLLTIKKETGSLKWTAAAFFLPTAVGAILCLICQAVL